MASDDLHLFGYGSLLWKAPFPYTTWQPCYVDGFKRVFFQGSTDHRGTPTKPGRVVTLLPCNESRCSGILFTVPFIHREDVLQMLDIREQDGYTQVLVSALDRRGNTISDRALCYRAVPENVQYLGSATESEIAAHIAQCTGESGSNEEYAIKLAECLRCLEFEDEHVFAVERYLNIQREIATPSTISQLPLIPTAYRE